MDNVDLEVLRQARDWLTRGQRVVLATIVRTFGSAPRPVGSMLVVNGDGEFRGSVSGGCVEEELIEQMRDGRHDRAQLLTFGITSEQSRRHGLPCGGRLELLVERLCDVGLLSDIVAAVEQRQTVTRRVSLRNSISRLIAGRSPTPVRVDGDGVEIVYGPPWRLLVIGAGDLGRYLATMAAMLDYRVCVCDPRREHWAAWSQSTAERSLSMPDDFIRDSRPDDRTAVVATTHDPKLDDMALLEALTSSAFYVGALGSRRTNAARRSRLAEHFELTAAQIARLHGPVGLPIGSRSAAEIAVAILAELTALRNGIGDIGLGAEVAADTAQPRATAACCAIPGG